VPFTGVTEKVPPLQVVAVMFVIAGVRFNVTVIGYFALGDPVLLFTSDNEPLYVAAGAPAGTLRMMGVEVKEARETFTKPAASAVAS
jgi:hypothetical protein